MAQHTFTNQLVHETSPYLLQHAHNPVNWLPWGDEAFEKAKEENKLVLVSIGYSSCHWCHVMEHESFENEAIAEVMNKNFICIKVDREERPDVDMVYMSAVQLMTGRGGWPLNCFVLPDARPVYGGTYFNIEQWQNVLLQLSEMYKNDGAKFLTYADDLTEGIKRSDLISYEQNSISKDVVTEAVEKWTKRFDAVEGGMNHAPKFPLPNNYLFLLRFAFLAKDDKVLNQVKLTLDKMAYGGIYDHAGGGFARYSTDMLWKAPHFEKMLYDNAQLISLYSEAYRAFKDPLYKQVVYETIDFINREMKSEEGFYFSAIDADSEGEEGKFYVWTKEDLSTINFTVKGLTIDATKCHEMVSDYFSVNDDGLWEHGNYILLRRNSDEFISKKYNVSPDELAAIIKSAKQKLLAIRNERIRPSLDDKSLTSWNALMISGLSEAYHVFNDNKFLNDALQNANLILQKLKKADGKLLHSYKNGKASITGFLEDYCFVMEAFIKLYECTFDEKWLQESNSLMEYVITHFSHETSNMFYFNADYDNKLIVRKTEIQDNVIPASNSVMANVLFKLGKYSDNKEYMQHSEEMLSNIINDIPAYASAYSNWCNLLLNFSFPFHEIVFTGLKSMENKHSYYEQYDPNSLIAGSVTDSHLSLLKDRTVKDKSLIYFCENNTCQLPVENVQYLKL
jgi:hypothetical protein